MQLCQILAVRSAAAQLHGYDAAKEVSPVEVAEHVSCACLCISTPQQVMKTMHVTQHAIQDDAGWCNAIAGERLCIGPWTRKLTLQTRFS